MNSYDFVSHFHGMAGIVARQDLAQFVERRVSAMTVEPFRIVDQNHMVLDRIAEQRVEFAANGRGMIEIVAIEPKKAWPLEAGKKPWQDFRAVAFEDVDVGILAEFPACAGRFRCVQFDRVKLAKPVSLYVEHVSMIRACFDEHFEAKIARVLLDRSLLHQVRHAAPWAAFATPQGKFSRRRNTLVPMEKGARAKAIAELGGHSPKACRSWRRE